jgi:phosphatidate cytidylyltransferase
MVAVLAAVVFLLPPLALVVLVVAALLMGAWEWSAFLRLEAPLPRVLYVITLITGLLAAWLWTGSRDGLQLMLALTALWWLVSAAGLWWGTPRFSRLHAVVAGGFALVPTGVALLRLRFEWHPGIGWFLFVLFLPFVADTVAYFAGRRFGSRRLAPAISPGKSVEGAVGGVLAAGVYGALCAPWLGQPRGLFTVLCLVAALFSVVGDLNESRFKRLAELKDSGHLLPGHGGVLDRIDSVTAAAPILLGGLLLLESLA